MSNNKIEEDVNDTRPMRGVYLLPNLLTTGALFAGFYAVVSALKGLFDTAALTIFIAMIMDSLDGRVARLTNTQSAFGREYDSLSDMVAFGVAPALVAYSCSLVNLGKFGWLVAFCYTACAALRLARFNIRTNTDKRFFYGLPSPPAAGIVAGLIWTSTEYNLYGTAFDILVLVVTLIAALLMVTNIRYYSFKEVDFRGKVPFIAVLIVVLLYMAISMDPPIVLLAGFSIFGLSGPIAASWRKIKNKKAAVV